MLIKNFVGVQLPLPFFSLLSSLLFLLLPLFLHLLLATAKESAGALSSLAGPVGARSPNDILVNFGLKECFW